MASAIIPLSSAVMVVSKRSRSYISPGIYGERYRDGAEILVKIFSCQIVAPTGDPKSEVINACFWLVDDSRASHKFVGLIPLSFVIEDMENLRTVVDFTAFDSMRSNTGLEFDQGTGWSLPL